MKQYKKYKRKNYRPSKNRGIIEASLIDKDFWSELKTCCGIVYENKMIGALLLVDSKFNNNHCVHHSRQSKTNLNAIKINQISSLSAERSENVSNSILSSALFNNNNNNGIMSKQQQSNINKQKYSNSSTKNSQQTDLPPMMTNNKKPDIDVLPAYLQSISNNNKLKKLESTEKVGESTRSYNYLHKIKSDSSKIVKQSMNKFAPTKFKTNDINLVKNFVRICTEKSTKNAHFIDGGGGEPKNDGLGNKFNENSSDSGYEEILQEPNQKGRLQSVRPVILANGIKLHVQPQNLVLAANLAGVSQMRQPAVSF